MIYVLCPISMLGHFAAIVINAYWPLIVFPTFSIQASIHTVKTVELQVVA